MLDVRAEKTNPKAPDFQCPDAQCLNDKGYRTGAWLPKGKAPAPAVGHPSAIAAPSDAGKQARLMVLYFECLDAVMEKLKREKLVDLFHGDAIASMVATLYIACSKHL